MCVLQRNVKFRSSDSLFTECGVADGQQQSENNVNRKELKVQSFITNYEQKEKKTQYQSAWDGLLASSRAWHRLHNFPRSVPVTLFPALGTGYAFSRAWQVLHVLTRMLLVAYFPRFAPVAHFRFKFWLVVLFSSPVIRRSLEISPTVLRNPSKLYNQIQSTLYHYNSLILAEYNLHSFLFFQPKAAQKHFVFCDGIFGSKRSFTAHFNIKLLSKTNIITS